MSSEPVSRESVSAPGDAAPDATSLRLVVLTERALRPDDAARIVALHAPQHESIRVLVPADTGRSLLADVLDHLSLLELRRALDAVRGRDETTRPEAGAALTSSLTALRAAGAEADGEVVDGDPLSRLKDATTDAEEVIVVTRPHAVEDTFHTDWASRARHELGVPVLHVYAGVELGELTRKAGTAT